MRNKLIGLAVVAVVAGLLWYFGPKLRERLDAKAPDDAAAPARVHDANTRETDADVGMSAVCLAMQTASDKQLDVARDAGWMRRRALLG